MFLTLADLERAEHYLDPVYLVQNGITLQFHYAIDAEDSTRRIAYRTYQPAELTLPGLVVVFVHDVHQSGELYDETAQDLAARGIDAAVLSLGWHGSGRWYSLDPQPLETLDLARYRVHIQLVLHALGADRLLLVGGGVLGSLLAQQEAVDNAQVVGLALLGGCLPSLAAATWQNPYHPQSQEAIKQVPGRWLGVVDDDPTAWKLQPRLGPESPRVWEGYEALAGKRIFIPKLPALVLAGECDTVVRREMAELTALEYGEADPIFLPGAPHLLVHTHQQDVTKQLVTFCQNVSTHSVAL